MLHLPALLAAALAAGTLAGLWFPGYGTVAALAGLAAGAAAVWAYAGRGSGGVVAVAALVAATGLSLARGASAVDAAVAPSLVSALESAGLLDDEAPRPRPTVGLTGRLAADAAAGGPSVLLRLAVQRAAMGPCACPLPVQGDVLVAVAGGLARDHVAQWRAGREVHLTATVRRPVTFRNLGAPDPALDLARRRLALTGSVKSALLVERGASGRWYDEIAAAIRARARRAVAAAAGDDRQAAAIGIAVLIGDRAGLDAELTERLQRAGTFHVIAISGGNIALLCLLSLWLVGRLFGTGRVALAMTAAILVAYAFVVGAGASVLRATGMAVVGLAVRTIDQKGLALNVLALTGGLLLVADPLIAADTGFWLTTAATAGLVVGLGDAGRSQRWRRLVRALVLTSVWAELALLPIVAAVFQQVTVAGVLLSAIAVPGMALAQMASMAAVTADVVAPWALATAGAALRAGAWLVTESARMVDLLPFLSWRVPPPHAGVVVTYYVALGAWLWTRAAGSGPTRARLRPVSVGLLALAAAWIAVAPASLVAWRRTQLELAVLDVGQGDAIVLRFPNGATMLVDAGGRAGSRFDVGGRVVGPTLRARGIRRLDYLVVTHADADHIGGAASLVAEFRPSEVWMGVPVAGDAATTALREAASAAGAAWRVVQRGDRVGIGAANVAVLHPPPPDWERQRVRNDDSVVLAVGLGGVQALLTGDIGAAVEAAVAAEAARSWAEVSAAPPAFTILKVAHHGSAGSTSLPFLEATRPAVAIVSAGVDDPFGHPARPALDRLAASRAALWRTDRDGEVTVRTDGRRVEVAAVSGLMRWWGPRAVPP